MDGWHEVVLAHELLHTFYTYYPDEFNSALLGRVSEKNGVEEYWARAKVDEDPRFVRHPMKSLPNYQSRAIPVQLHGDGVPFKKTGIGSSLNCTLWKSIVGFGLSTWDHHYLWDCYVAGIETDMFTARRWRIMKWDWWCALHGFFPYTYDDGSEIGPEDEVRYSRRGEAIAGGYALAISGWLNDVKYQVEDPHWVNSFTPFLPGFNFIF